MPVAPLESTGVGNLICGFQMTSETLSLLALKPARKGWAVAGGALATHDGEKDDLAASLKALARAAHAPRAAVTAVLPKQQGIMRNVTLPSVDPAELAQMARFEVERHIPFHAERHCSGYHVMRKMGVEGSEVLLAAVDGPIIQRALDGLAGADLSSAGVTLSSVALCNSLLHERRDWLPGKTVAVIAMGLDTLDLVLLTDGRVLFARSAPLDLRSMLEALLYRREDAARIDLTRLAHAARMADCMKAMVQPAGNSADEPAAEPPSPLAGWLARVIQELRRTWDFARREMKCPPVDAVVLTGEGAALQNVAEYFRASIDAEVHTLNPVAALPGAAAQKFPFEGLEHVAAFGAAIADQLEGAWRIDLTPPDHYRALARRRTRGKLIMTGSLMVLTLALGAASWLRLTDIRSDQMQALSDEIERLRPVVGELHEMSAKLDIIHGYMDDPNNALRVLASSTRSSTIPDRVSLAQISYKMNEGLTINGHAKSIPDLDAYHGDLRRTGHLRDPITRNQQNPASYNGQTAYGFTLSGNFTRRTEEER